MADHTTQSQQNNIYRSRIHGAFKTEFSFLFGKEEQSLHDTIHDIITDSSKNIEDIKKKIITKLQSGIDINKANPEGKTPVMYLLEKIKELKGKYRGTLKQAASFLIERGADIENTDTESQEQSEDKGQKTFIDKLKKLNLFGHPESITEKDIDSINESRKILEEKAKKILEEKANEESTIAKGATEESIIVKGTVKNVAMYGNCLQVQLQSNNNTWEFKTSEFLNSDFYQKSGVSGLSIVNEDGTSGLHCAVYGGIKHYVMTNDCSYKMALKWWIEGKKYEITINIDADGSVELIEGNGVTWEQLEAHKDVKLGDLFLAEALKKGRWKDGLQQSEETIKSAELQQEQSEETVISVGRGVEANYEHNKSKTHFGHNKVPVPQPPKVPSGSDHDEANNSERNVKTSTPNNNAPLTNFSVSPITFNKTSSNQVPAHNLGILTDDYCEDTGKRTITYNDGSVAVIEDVPDERDSVAVEAQQQPTLLAITYPDDDKKSNTQSSNSLEDDKFASTTMKPTINSSPYFSSLPPVNSFKPKQPPSVHTQQQQKAQDEDQTPVEANPSHYNHEEVLNECDPFRNNNVEKTTELTESEFPSDELQIDSGFSSPTHTTRPAKVGNKSIVEEPSGLEGSTSGVSLKPVDPRDLSPRTERRLSEDGLREEYSINANGRTEIFNSNNWPIHSSSVISTDSGFSSPMHSGSNKSQVDPERLENIARILVELRELDEAESSIASADDQGSEWGLESDSSLDSDDELKERYSGYISEWELESDSSLDSDDELKERYSGYIDDGLEDIGAKLGNGKYVKKSDLGEVLKHRPLFAEGEVSPSAKDYHPLLKQAKEGLKKLGPNGKRSPQTEAHLIEAGLLPASENKQSISEINRKTFPVNAGTSKYLSCVKDTYSMIHPLLKKDEEQSKVGVIEEEREGVSTEGVNSNDRNRVKLGKNGQKLSKEICGPWTRQFSQQQQEQQEKQQKKHEERGVLRS